MLHTRRLVSVRRPMHLTMKLKADLPSLRRAGPRAAFRVLLAEARSRGVRTVSFQLMGNHIHWLVMPESAASLRDATRYVFGQLARRLNKMWGRRGKVFVERYFSTIGTSARQIWNTLNYIARNPYAAGIDGPGQGFDKYFGLDAALLTTERFLRAIFGADASTTVQLVERMSRHKLSYVPLFERLQPSIPGLGP